MEENLIAPCGMICSLCISYHFMEKDLNKQGFHKTYWESGAAQSAVD
ncbi:hypothetical protein ASZ90_017196 [hydrocarbon metagenome]|uniref:Uncharacterized protein n=1 Tax=hydrocarbon metagenome TaxID=938273 RepID=A0A0W8E9S2_9ZZZZ